MYFNRKNAEQKNWRMIKKGKHFLFGCSLVFAVGAALVAPSVKADTVETKPEAGSTMETTKPTTGEENVTYAAPAVKVAPSTPVAPATVEAEEKAEKTATTTENSKEEAVATTDKVEKAKEADSIQAPEVTVVYDPSALTDAEKAKVAEEVKKANPTATDVKVNNDGSVVVTFADGSVATIAANKVVKEATKESSVQAPSLTTVADASALTAEEISNVTEAIKGSNPTAVSVQVSNDGSAVVTFADGSSATLSASQTVKVKAEATSEAPTRSRRALSPENGISTRSFDSELQDAAQKKAIYSPGVKGEKQTYQGTVWLYRNGTVNNDNQEDAKRLGGVNVYLQYVTGKGFVSPVYKTTSEQDGTFVFDLSKPLANRLGATGEFKLAGDPKLAIRTWVENPDPTKYTVIKSGDQRTGFHGRLSRLNETWDFTAGINRIVGGQVVLQEKPNSED